MEDQVRVLLRSVEGCGSNGQKHFVNRRLFAFLSLIVDVASVAKCWRQKLPNLAFAGTCTLSEYSPSSHNCVNLIASMFITSATVGGSTVFNVFFRLSLSVYLLAVKLNKWSKNFDERPQRMSRRH